MCIRDREETYEILRMNLAGILAEKDDYLDVFVSDMKYSDQPLSLIHI